MADGIFTIAELEAMPVGGDGAISSTGYYHITQEIKDQQLVELRASNCDNIFLMYRPEKPKMVGGEEIDLELIQANVTIPEPIDWRMRYHKFMEKLIVLDHNVEDNSRGDTLYRQSVNRRMKKALFPGQTEEHIKETIAAVIAVHRRADEAAAKEAGDE
jgi:hypothetical protein